MKNEIVYSLYDSRYTANPEDACLYLTCSTLKEAKADKKEMFTDAVIVKETVLWAKQTGECIVINAKIIAI